MPRFFFHIVDDEHKSPDEEGLDLENADAARRECEESARDLLIHDLKDGRPIDHRRIEAMDESGEMVAVCTLRDLVQ